MNLTSVHYIVQPSSSLVQADWGTPESGVYTLPRPCKGAELISGSSNDGVLEIHLVDDNDGKWYLMPLTDSERKGAVFDKIRTTNTTVQLNEIVCFPV